VSLACPCCAQIVARVFDEVNIPGRVLRAAEEEAASALATGGIALRWTDCSHEQACRAPLAPNELVIVIRLSRPATVTSRKGEVLGNAAGPQGGSGVYAWVWYDEVRRAAAIAGLTTWHDLLGCVIAHEIGHLLLGPDHYGGTVMQANWGLHELALISQQRLGFDAGQRLRMQSRALARCRPSRAGAASRD
jgi:hypothetical protein